VIDLIPAEFEVLDPRFVGTGGDRFVARLFSAGRWLEGPAYHPAGRFVLFSDIPNDRVLRCDEVSERTDIFITRAGFTNGRTVDRQGRFVTCEHGERRVTRTEHDGSIKVLATAYKDGGCTAPTTSWSIRTRHYGLPIQATESITITRATKPNPRSALVTSTVSILTTTSCRSH
jgi:gluconolactonase